MVQIYIPISHSRSVSEFQAHVLVLLSIMD